MIQQCTCRMGMLGLMMWACHTIWRCGSKHPRQTRSVKAYQYTSVALTQTSVQLLRFWAIWYAGDPFFMFQDGRFLTRDRFVAQVRRALQTAGVDSSQYAGRSFHIGAATTAALCEIQDSLIKTLGRWESSAYTLYIRTPRTTLCSISHRLVSK